MTGQFLSAGSERPLSPSPSETAVDKPPPFATPVPGSQLICTLPDGESAQPQGCHLDVLADYLPAFDTTAVFSQPCIAGLAAGTYPCQNIHLLSYLPLQEIGGGNGNDIWGWTDPATRQEIVIMGRSNGTAFIDISDPQQPRYLANLPTAANTSSWRDIKVHQNHAYIVADYAGIHAMQIVDLTQLRNITAPPVTLTATVNYTSLQSAHNIAINDATQRGYVVGIPYGPNRCDGGLHILDLSTPASPQFAGCYTADGYVHDTQCVLYTGPDSAHQGQEICFNASVSAFSIVDVTDAANPSQLSTQSYTGVRYAHQGWLTDDQRYFLLDDEGDESTASPYAKTYIWDVSDLENPQLIGTHLATEPGIDHNLYIRDDLVYQSNYRTGLRVLSLENVAAGQLTEVAYFDTFPQTAVDEVAYNGAWSSYPFFQSGSIAVSTIEHGLFVLQLDGNVFTGSQDPPDLSNHFFLPLMRQE